MRIAAIIFTLYCGFGVVGSLQTESAGARNKPMSEGIMRRCIVAVAWLCVFLFGAVARPGPQYADADPKIATWFSHQYNARHQWCCDNADGHRFDGAYSFDPDGSVEFDAGGMHYHLPAYMVLTGPNPTGHAVWWFLVSGRGKHVDYCFAPGAGS